MLEGNFYNIDKVNCIIQKKSEGDVKVYNTKAVPKVIYKPIFYRTYDLQNIQFRIGLKQNIGINLAEYMTKIEGFKLSIEGNEFVEFARNDIYVIFKIDSTRIVGVSGVYHILDQDGEYISSGNWNVLDT